MYNIERSTNTIFHENTVGISTIARQWPNTVVLVCRREGNDVKGPPRKTFVVGASEAEVMNVLKRYKAGLENKVLYQQVFSDGSKPKNVKGTLHIDNVFVIKGGLCTHPHTLLGLDQRRSVWVIR